MIIRRTTWRRCAAALTAALAAATTAAACSGIGGDSTTQESGTPGFDPDCVVVDSRNRAVSRPSRATAVKATSASPKLDPATIAASALPSSSPRRARA